MAFKDGDFIEIEYSVYDAVNNTLIETSDEKKAKEHEMYDEHARYGKKLVILGFNRIINGLDNELRKMDVNQEKKFTFKPEDAFGQRNEELVKIMRVSDLRAKGVDPYPGMKLDIDGVHATVRSVNSGRVVIDANHPYAGRDILYELKVVGNPVKDDEKVKSLSHAYDVEPTSMKIENKTVALDYGSSVKKNEEYFVEKSGLINSLFENMKNIDAITVQEHYKRESKPDKETKVEKEANN